ncbi:MAG: GNAT family N-acetyltransferase [Gammaproteobacteria bacterium]
MKRPATGRGGATKLLIRDAVAADLPAVLNLLEQLEFGEHRQLSLAEAREIFSRTTADPHHHLYVAIAEGHIVGTFAFIVIDSIAHAGAPHAIVEDVVVDPNYRGHGIGKQMMQFAMDRCREAGCYKMALSSHLQREQAHAFYESLGFRKHGFSFLVQ